MNQIIQVGRFLAFLGRFYNFSTLDSQDYQSDFNFNLSPICIYTLNQNYISLHMNQDQPQPKKNALMQLFYKRQADPLPQTKTAKKIKTNENKEDDPLYKILSWRDDYQEYVHPKEGTYKIVKEKSIIKADQSKWSENVQGIFVNIDWDSTSIDELNALNLSQNLIKNGIVFIWGAKTNIGAMMDYFEKMNFFYVQNFIFVLLNRKKTPERSLKTTNGTKNILSFFQVDKSKAVIGDKKKQEDIEKDYQIGKVDTVNTIFCNEQSEYFKQTQKVLYMFRKISKSESLELRHQRTSDVYFTIGDSLKLDWKSKQIVYKMIETLLISANYKQKQNLKLVELWGEDLKPRKGWVTVVQESSDSTGCSNSLQESQKEIKEVQQQLK